MIKKYKKLIQGFMNKELIKEKPASKEQENMSVEDKLSDRQFELYKQLHEQFAVNDNNKTSNVISFIAAIITVFAGYGYVIYNSEEIFYLVGVTFVSHLVLLFLFTLCIFFGYSTRRDQIITFKIRDDYGIVLPYKKPSGRGDKWYGFLPDYYKIIAIYCMLFIIAIIFISVFKLWIIKADFLRECCGIVTVIGYFIFFILIPLIIYRHYHIKFCKFEERPYV